jgi:short-subunit dehydrogenase
MTFRHQNVWITGASAGIGAALAQALAAKGANLILSARRETELRQVQATCRNQTNQVEVLPVDLTQPESIYAAAQRAEKIFPAIDILIHSAGVSQRALARDTEAAVDRAIMELNYFGTVALTRAVLPSMLARRSGHLVVLSSVAGKVGSPMRSSYSASKHALHGYFDCLRAEVFQAGIDVTLICPGYIATNITLNAYRGNGQRYGKVDQLLKNGMPVEECARRILRGIAKKSPELVVSAGKEKYAVYLQRFLPSLLFKIVRQHVPS